MIINPHLQVPTPSTPPAAQFAKWRHHHNNTHLFLRPIDVIAQSDPPDGPNPASADICSGAFVLRAAPSLRPKRRIPRFVLYLI